MGRTPRSERRTVVLLFPATSDQEKKKTKQKKWVGWVGREEHRRRHLKKKKNWRDLTRVCRSSAARRPLFNVFSRVDPQPQRKAAPAATKTQLLGVRGQMCVRVERGRLLALHRSLPLRWRELFYMVINTYCGDAQQHQLPCRQAHTTLVWCRVDNLDASFVLHHLCVLVL
jgi:hypothetical protein